MKNIPKIGIGLLAVAFFASGYALRVQCAHNEQIAAASQNKYSLAQSSRIASIDLDEPSNIDLRPVETLYSVMRNLREHYVEQLTPSDEGKMTHDALAAMLASLNDPNTRFIEQDQRKIVADAQNSKYHGIGAILGIKRIKSGSITEEHLIVVTPIASGPAEKSGIKAGDDITALDGKTILPFDPYQRATLYLKNARNKKTDQSILKRELEGEQKKIENGISILEAEDKLDSQDGKSVELTIARKGSAKPIKIKLQTSAFKVDPVAGSVIDGGKYAYIKINDFSGATSAEFADKLKMMTSSGIKGLVLDLRNVAGGQENAVVQTAKYIAPGKTFAILKKAHNKKSVITIPNNKSINWKKPVVVLVNSGTAKLAEVLASSLKDNKVAKLVGAKTYGDFIYTTLIDQADGSAVEMTTGKLLSIKGKDYSGTGVPVDVAVSSTASGDNQLDKAVKLLGRS